MYVDFGNKEWVKRGELLEIPGELCVLPAAAINFMVKSEFNLTLHLTLPYIIEVLNSHSVYFDIPILLVFLQHLKCFVFIPCNADVGSLRRY